MIERDQEIIDFNRSWNTKIKRIRENPTLQLLLQKALRLQEMLFAPPARKKLLIALELVVSLH